MKLLELLVKERIKWPDNVESMSQVDEVHFKCKISKLSMMTALSLGGVTSFVEELLDKTSPLRVVPKMELADDWQTAIVTKEQYENACKLVDDGYTLWFGGECPVPYYTLVDLAFDDNADIDSARPAFHYDWKNQSSPNIIAYKVVPVKQLGVREPIGFNCRCDSVPVVTEYPAHSFLEKGVQHMKDRDAQRNSAEGERSMAACVNAFNAMFGKDLTETQGWQFMVLLKMARSRNKFNPDDYEDGAAYTGLAGEAHSHE